MKHAYERWVLALDVPADGDAPPAIIVRHVLKRLWRAWGVKCKGFSVDEELLKLRKEVAELREHLGVLTAGNEEAKP